MKLNPMCHRRNLRPKPAKLMACALAGLAKVAEALDRANASRAAHRGPMVLGVCSEGSCGKEGFVGDEGAFWLLLAQQK